MQKACSEQMDREAKEGVIEGQQVLVGARVVFKAETFGAVQ